jgi:hypothetical protein
MQLHHYCEGISMPPGQLHHNPCNSDLYDDTKDKMQTILVPLARKQ